MKKYFKTIIEIEILSEDEPVGNGLSLGEINDEITQGHCSGQILTKKEEEVSAKDMATLLINQQSDPEFFGLDEDGNEVDEDEKENL